MQYDITKMYYICNPYINLNYTNTLIIKIFYYYDKGRHCKRDF